jgi:hypothetical protein
MLGLSEAEIAQLYNEQILLKAPPAEPSSES